MNKLPSGNKKNLGEHVVRSCAELGLAIKVFRKEQKLKQVELAGIANTGNRLIVDLEKGKPTLQLQKVLAVIDFLGLDVVIRKRG